MSEPTPTPTPTPDRDDFFPDPAPTPTAYLLTVRESVWTLRRHGRVQMRSRDLLRVERKLSGAALEEAATSGRDVAATKIDADGRAHTLTFTAEKARKILGIPGPGPERFAEGGGS